MMTYDGSNASARIQVLLLTEGTYPFHWGGVSTWCHLLIRDLPEVDFTLLSLVADPQLVPQLVPPSNVVDFRPVALWGIREMQETKRELTLGTLLKLKRDTSERTIELEFVPHFRSFLQQLFTTDGEAEQLGATLHQMYRFFLAYDFDMTFRSQAVWKCFTQALQQHFPSTAARHGYPDASFTLGDVTVALQWLYHWFFPLAKPLPEVDVVHASMAGMCTMIGAIVKQEYGAGFMLTEHGIYLRERYIFEATSSGSFFLKLFSLRFARRMTSLGYAMADQISPCCDYNQRWELRNGASPDRLRTIYYGADADEFTPGGKEVGAPPVIVWVGRINPLKDVITLLRAAALVHQVRPDIQFRLYGSAGREEQQYYAECLALRTELGLEDSVIFEGFIAKPADAYNEGDVVLLSSISEGFPFATLEAMLCGKPVVATAVGGLPEQIEGCGIVVEPRNPAEMAEALLTLMNDATLCAELGLAARSKATEAFTVRQSADAHHESYTRLIKASARSVAAKPVEAPGQGGVETHAMLAEASSDQLYLNMPTHSNEGWQTSVAVEASVLHHSGNVVDVHSVLAVGESSSGSLVTAPATSNTITAVTHIANSRHHISLLPRRKRPLIAANNADTWTPKDVDAIRALAEEVMQRDAQPIDYLEVTAVLESLGITDDVASAHYGAPDTFALAERVLVETQNRRASTQPLTKEHTPNVGQTNRSTVSDYMRGPIVLFPGVMLLLIIEAYSRLGQWQPNQVLILSVALTSSLLFTNAFTLGMMPRGSRYLSVGNVAAAHQFLTRSWAVALACLLVGVVSFCAGAAAIGLVTVQEGFFFCLAFVAMAMIWLTGARLVLVQAQVWLGIGLAAGLGVGVMVDWAAQPFSTWHLGFGTIAGFTVTMTTIVTAIMASATSTKPGKSAKQVLPSIGYMTYEAAPYFAYGLLYMVFMLIPHLLGWYGMTNTADLRLWIIQSLEGGLTLALPPLLLASGVAERTLRLFWQHAQTVQRATSGQDPHLFGRSMLRFYRGQLMRYLVVLTIISIVAYFIVQWSLRTSLVTNWLGLTNIGLFMLVLQTSLVCYFLLGWGVFNCMFILTLSRPGMTMRALLPAIVVTLAVGLPLSLAVHFTYTLVAFIAGALTFVVISSKTVNEVLEAADYYYSSAL